VIRQKDSGIVIVIIGAVALVLPLACHLLLSLLVPSSGNDVHWIATARTVVYLLWLRVVRTLYTAVVSVGVVVVVVVECGGHGRGTLRVRTPVFRL